MRGKSQKIRYGLFGYLLLLLVVVFFGIIYLENMYTKNSSVSPPNNKTEQVFNDSNVEFIIPSGLNVNKLDPSNYSVTKPNEYKGINIMFNYPTFETADDFIKNNKAQRVGNNLFYFEAIVNNSNFYEYIYKINQDSFVQIETTDSTLVNALSVVAFSFKYLK